MVNDVRLDGVAENEIVIEHQCKTDQDNDGAAPRKFFSHKIASLRSQ